MKRTSTGIYSSLPSTKGATLPDNSSDTIIKDSSFHADIIGQAKVEAARKEFYGKFQRGRSLEGTQSDQEIAIDNKVAKSVARVQLQKNMKQHGHHPGGKREQELISRQDEESVVFPAVAHQMPMQGEESDYKTDPSIKDKKGKKKRKRLRDGEETMSSVALPSLTSVEEPPCTSISRKELKKQKRARKKEESSV